MLTNYALLDISTAPLSNAADYLDADAIRAPSNWKDESKITAYRAEKLAERLDGAALDFDLAQITGIAITVVGCEEPVIIVGENERGIVEHAANYLRDVHQVVTYNGRSFDVPMLKRRAMYLGLKFPHISTDRYKGDVVDLMQLLSDSDPSRRRSLSFYCKRLAWSDLHKPLDGAAESKVLDTQDWTGLRASLAHDLEAIRRLAVWAGVIAPVAAS